MARRGILSRPATSRFGDGDITSPNKCIWFYLFVDNIANCIKHSIGRITCINIKSRNIHFAYWYAINSHKFEQNIACVWILFCWIFSPLSENVWGAKADTKASVAAERTVAEGEPKLRYSFFWPP